MTTGGAQSNSNKKTNIIFGYSQQAYSTNSRSSFTPLSKGNHRPNPILSSSGSQFRLGDVANDFSTDSIASSHHRPLVETTAMQKDQTSSGSSAFDMARQCKKALQESHLPWQEKPSFFTFSRAMPTSFIKGDHQNHQQQQQHRHPHDIVPKPGLVLGSDQLTYSTSSNAATTFTEGHLTHHRYILRKVRFVFDGNVTYTGSHLHSGHFRRRYSIVCLSLAKAEFGANAFFGRDRRRQTRGDDVANPSRSSGNGDRSGQSPGTDVPTHPSARKGIVLGYDPAVYQCTNSMSRYFDRSNCPLPDKPRHMEARQNKTSKTNILFG